LQNHGILVAGSSLRRAADQAEVLERSSQLILGCYAVGREPPVIPEDILATLREAGKMMG
jgi:ribulose-5-phosphate 4-epimerase/fuculose-1-phosphate aldolase